MKKPVLLLGTLVTALTLCGTPLSVQASDSCPVTACRISVCLPSCEKPCDPQELIRNYLKNCCPELIRLLEQTDTVQPEAEQPVVVQPEAEQSVTVQSEEETPVIVQPEAEQPVTVQPEAEQPVTVQPEAEQPVIVQPEAEQPVTVQPEAEQPVIVQPEAEQPVTVQPEAEQPVTVQPEAEQPVTVQPEAEQPVTVQPEAEQPVAESSYEEQVVDLVNAYRAQAGLPALTADTTLQTAALARAKETVQLFSHTRPNGTSCFTILQEYGISYRYAGENIAYGQRSPEEVVNAWMNSEGHRANIMSSQFTTIGIGYYQAANGTRYWSQLFLSR